MPEIAEDVKPDPILAMFTGMDRPALVAACNERNIPAAGPGTTAAVLLRRLIDFEQVKASGADPSVVSEDDDDPLGLDDADGGVLTDGSDPEPPAAGVAASASAAGPGTEGVVGRPATGATTHVRPQAAVVQPVDDAPAPVTGTIARFRKAFVVGDMDPSDEQHFGMIAKTHDAAAAAGHRPRGGRWAGERIGYGSDKNGVRTAIYEVSIRRK